MKITKKRILSALLAAAMLSVALVQLSFPAVSEGDQYPRYITATLDPNGGILDENQATTWVWRNHEAIFEWRFGNQIDIPFPLPSKPGYTFEGWFSEKTGGVNMTKRDSWGRYINFMDFHFRYSDDNTVALPVEYILVERYPLLLFRDTITLYAQWSEGETVYTAPPTLPPVTNPTDTNGETIEPWMIDTTISMAAVTTTATVYNETTATVYNETTASDIITTTPDIITTAPIVTTDVLYCVNCGFIVNGKFCSECGAPVSATAPEETTTPEVIPEVPYDPCADCKLCSAIAENGYSAVKGHILGEDEPEVFDFVEILSFLIKMPDAKIATCGNAFYAAILSKEGKAAGEPTIFCGIEILLYLVGLTDGSEW